MAQFSVTEHVKSSEAGQLQSLPGVFFFYDLSPIKVSVCVRRGKNRRNIQSPNLKFVELPGNLHRGAYIVLALLD